MLKYNVFDILKHYNFKITVLEVSILHGTK